MQFNTKFPVTVIAKCGTSQFIGEDSLNWRLFWARRTLKYFVDMGGTNVCLSNSCQKKSSVKLVCAWLKENWDSQISKVFQVWQKSEESVCLCACVTVCMCVCLLCCGVQLFSNEIPAQLSACLGRGWRRLATIQQRRGGLLKKEEGEEIILQTKGKWHNNWDWEVIERWWI